jgi:hypothetical protein
MEQTVAEGGKESESYWDRTASFAMMKKIPT